MAELFSTFFRTGIFGSVIILVILLVRPLLRKAPRQIICILWILAAVRLLVPFQLESRLSFQPQFTPQSDTIATVIKATTPSETSPVHPSTQLITTPSVDTEQGPLTTPDVSTVPRPIEPDVRPAPIPDSTATGSIPQQHTATNASPFCAYRQTISAVWLGIALSLLLYAVAAYCIMKYKMREAVKSADGVLETRTISGAFLLGYFKPEIYLPEGLNEQDRAFIVSHEQAHIRRGDNWWKLLGLLCVCIHWYNPLVWVSYTLLCRDIEIACDERVIGAMQLDDRKAYSLALLNSEKRMSGLFVYPVAFGEISLKQRIKNVLSYRKPGFWITFVAIVLVGVVVACFMTTPKTDSTDVAQKETISTSSQAENNTSGESNPATSGSTEPSKTQPTESEPAKPEPTEPEPTEPEPTEPEPTEPEPTEPEPTEPEPTEPEPTVPEPTEPEPVPDPEPPEPVVTIVAEGQCAEGETQWKISSDGVLTISGNWGIAESSAYPWKDYSDTFTEIIIEDGIIAISKDAFSGMTGLTSVRLSSSVKTIYPRAFYGCTSLSSLILPSNCQLERIGEYAFAGTGLTSFSAPSSLRRIDSHAFLGCSRLQNVVLEGGVEIIEGNAFKSCASLKHVTLGESIQTLDAAFEDCPSLETADICTNNGWGFGNCQSLRSVTIGGNVTSIHELWFSCCSSLSEVIITAPVKTVQSNAFYYCSTLKSIVLPDTVEEIKSEAFIGTGLTSITFPPNLKKLGVNPFAETGLQEVVFLGDAPQMHNITFSGLTLTAYYPSNNETWTADKLQDYGGTITWIPCNKRLEETL